MRTLELWNGLDNPSKLSTTQRAQRPPSKAAGGLLLAVSAIVCGMNVLPDLHLTEAEECATLNAFLALCRSSHHPNDTPLVTQVLDIRNKIIVFTVNSTAYTHGCQYLPDAEYPAWLELLDDHRQTPYWIREKPRKDGTMASYVSLNPKVSARQRSALYRLYVASARVTVFWRE